MRRYVALGIVGVLLLGAAATVSREEFDELRGRVAVLEARTQRLEAALKELQEAKVDELMGVEVASETPAPPPEAEVPGETVLSIADLPTFAALMAATEAQREHWRKSAPGRWLTGQGIVFSVLDEGQNYCIRCDVVRPTKKDKTTYRIAIKTPQASALNVKAGQRCQFRGKITAVAIQELSADNVICLALTDCEWR